MSGVCPNCGSDDVGNLVFGLIDDPMALGANVILAGCCVDGDWKWQCSSCRYRFGGEKSAPRVQPPVRLFI